MSFTFKNNVVLKLNYMDHSTLPYEDNVNNPYTMKIAESKKIVAFRSMLHHKSVHVAEYYLNFAKDIYHRTT